MILRNGILGDEIFIKFFGNDLINPKFFFEFEISWENIYLDIFFV